MIHGYTPICFGTSTRSAAQGSLLLRVLFLHQLHWWLGTDGKKSALLHSWIDVG